MPFRECNPGSQPGGARCADQSGRATADNHQVVDRARFGVHPIRWMHSLEQNAIGFIERRETHSVIHSRS